jgi:xanthine dehydrogenase accessory factor
MAVAESGDFAGSVSGGCIEGAVVDAAREAIKTNQCKLLEFGVRNETAWDVGLACGGRIQVFVEPRVETRATLIENARQHKKSIASVTDLVSGRWCVVDAEARQGDLALSPEQASEVRRRIAGDQSGMMENGGLFVRVYGPPVRMVIVGAVHIAQALAPMAQLSGFDVTVIDPRESFARAGSLAGIHAILEWPDDGMKQVRPDARTAVVTLTHDPKLDDPALAAALRSEAFYIGALGSRKTHAKRLERLREMGFSGDETARIHGPVGLDINALTPAEIAVSIMAQVIASLRLEAAW